MKFQKGDKVEFLDKKGKGIIVSIIDKKTVIVLTENKFKVPVLANELIKINENTSSLKDIKVPTINKNQSLPPQPIKKPSSTKKKKEIQEIDLHIDMLTRNRKGLNNSDMMSIQLQKVIDTLNENLDKKGKEIIFIHGVGAGILKQEITQILDTQYPNIYYQDASFSKYGFGATKITIR